MFEKTHLESIFLLRRNQEVDLHEQELKTVPDWIFKILQILFLKCFFFRRFFHIFTIANELTGFSISRLASMEDFLRGTARKVYKYGCISGPYFLVFRLNTERYDLSVFSPNRGKNEPEITPYLDIFHAVRVFIWHCLLIFFPSN